ADRPDRRTSSAPDSFPAPAAETTGLRIEPARATNPATPIAAAARGDRAPRPPVRFATALDATELGTVAREQPTRSLRVFGCERRNVADPDVTEPNRIPVVLQVDGRTRRMRGVRRRAVPTRGAEQLGVVLNQHAIVQHGHITGFDERAVIVELRRVKHDVVTLPFARF